MTTTKPFSKTMAIRFQDCDPAGIVYYPNFLDKVEAVIEDWLDEALGKSYRDWIFLERGGLARVKVVCDFMKPCTMGDRLEITILLKKVERSSFELETIGRVGGEVYLKIGLVLVHISLESRKAIPFSDGFRAKLERYRALSATQS